MTNPPKGDSRASSAKKSQISSKLNHPNHLESCEQETRAVFAIDVV